MVEASKLLEIDNNLSIAYGNPGSIAGISSYLAPKENTIVFVKTSKFLNELGRLESNHLSNFSIVTTEDFYKKNSEPLGECKSLFLSKNISESMCTLSKPFYDELYKDLNYFVDGRQLNLASIDPFSDISQDVFIGSNVTIEKNVVIMSGVRIMPNVHIKEGTIIYPNVTIYPYVQIGKNCRVHSNTTIGSDGFGYNFVNGAHQKIWHIGGVRIEDDVEIGSNTCIDNGCFIETFIGSGTKIDNQVQISHNARIGKNCILCGKSGVAGSCELEDYVVFAAGSGAAPGARIGAGSQIAAAAVISENAIVPAKSTLAGHPARPLKEWLKTKAKINQLVKS